MLKSHAVLTQVPLTLDPTSDRAGISNVFAAAVVSRSFCKMLLSDPDQALKEGYMGQKFGLSPEDSALIVSIRAASLPDLARQVVQTLGR
jgi:hypothetical protein